MTWANIKPAQQQRLGDAVFEALERLIRNGELRAGQKLASEEELSTRFQVSRPVVRAALKQLREQNLIVSRKGSGSFVADEVRHEAQQQAATSQLKNMLYALEFRKSVEPEAARFAALRRGAQELADLEAALEAFRSTSESPLQPRVDFLLHKAIATASLNAHYVRALDLISYDIDLGVTLAEHLSKIGPADRRRAIFGEHKSIVDAIRDQDPDAAEAAMMRHLEYAQVRVIARGEAIGASAH